MLDIQTFIEDIPLEDFLDDKCSENTVAMSLATIGEIATVLNNKYPEFKKQHQQIPQRYMLYKRNTQTWLHTVILNWIL